MKQDGSDTPRGSGGSPPAVPRRENGALPGAAPRAAADDAASRNAEDASPKRGDALSRHDSVRLFRRREQKYEVGRAAAVFIREEIARRLPLFEFERGHPSTHVTTLYFDTRNRDFFRRAVRNYDDNVKIRVKEYYYELPPSAGSGEPGRNGAVHAYKTSPICYVELKQSAAGTVIKKRFGFPKRELPLLLGGQDVWPILLKMTPPEDVAPLREVYREFQRYLGMYLIEITSIVNYRRTVYQESENELRITFDDQLAVYQPVATLYDGADALTPEVLGRPIRTSDKVILEIKCPGTYPSWLEKTMQYHSTRRLSKFTTSVRLLLSESNGAALDGASEPSNGPTGNFPADDAARDLDFGADTKQGPGFLS
jgi:hypothetical protein